MSTLAQMDHKYLWHPFTQQQTWTQSPPLMVERAEGCRLFDTDGRSYIDGVSSLWTNVHGHRHPVLDRALRDQIDKVAHSTFLGLSHPPGVELAAKLIERAPSTVHRVFFSDNGSTAVEVALKMAFQFCAQTGSPQRTRFATLRDAYHGDTLGSVSVGAIELFHQIYRPLLFESVILPAPTTPGGEEEEQALEQALRILDREADTLAALVVEPLVQGAAGMKMHSEHFLRTLCAAARERGVLLIADEVAVGFGRLGSLFAVELAEVEPDFLCLAKGIAAGYLPLAATLASERVYEAFLDEPDAYRQFFHGHTFTANPLACAVALASLDLFDRTGLLTRVREHEEALRGLLAPILARPTVSAVRHRGVMCGIDLTDRNGSPLPKANQTGHRAAMAARVHGAIVRPLGDTLVLNPPLAIARDELAELVAATGRAIDDVS
jgi:adenosylmethionine---8-amino-7-oxononanoate aminotransferase